MRTPIQKTCWLALLALLALSAVAQPAPVQARRWLRWAYFVPDNSRAEQSIRAHHAALDVIAPDLWRLQPNGTVRTRAQPAVTKLFASWGLQVIPMVAKDSWSEKLRTLLGSPQLRAKAVAQLGALVAAGDYPGIHLDIENIDRRDAVAYQRFVAALAAEMHRQGRLMTLALPAKAVGEPDWYPAYNYAALGALVDLVVIMAYDHGYAGGQPAPVAPLPWVNNVVRYTTARIPAGKVVMGIPWYGYDWNTTTGAAGRYVSHGQGRAVGGAHRYDAAAAAVTAAERRADGRHVVWYENATSISAKLGVVVDHELAGWAAWRLGYEDPALWAALAPRR